MTNPDTEPSEPEARKIFGRYLREARRKAGFSQVKLAEILEVSPQHIHNYESGKSWIPFPRLVIASRVLNVPLNYFLYGEAVLAERPLSFVPSQFIIDPDQFKKIAEENWPGAP